jgi:hypothetical protein
MSAVCTRFFCMHSYLLYMLRKTLQLYRFEQWNVTNEMINQAKTDYIAVSGPDAVGKWEPLKKTGLAVSISAFLAASAPGLQVSPVVALQNMIRWGNFKPDGLFCYHVVTEQSIRRVPNVRWEHAERGQDNHVRFRLNYMAPCV